MRAKQWLCGLALVTGMAIGLLGAAGEARAHYYDHTLDRWLFHGSTFVNDSDHDERRDPVNMMIWPYARAAGGEFFDRIHTHFGQHWRRGSWRRESQIPNYLLCKEDLIMRFRAVVHVWRQTDEHAAGLDRGQPDAGAIPDACATRWHARLWTDGHILHQSPVDGSPVADGHRGNGDYADSFGVGNFHYEVQKGYLGQKCVPPESWPAACYSLVKPPFGHKLPLKWDETEAAVVERMRSKPKAAAHADAHGKADMGHCATKRWRVLPGSSRPGSSDGVLARVSMLHCPKA